MLCHFSLAVFGQHRTFGKEHVAELTQVDHVGGNTAAALNPDQLAGLGVLDGQGIVGIAVKGRTGAVSAQRTGDVLFTVFAERLTGDGSYRHFGKGKTVIAIYRIFAGLGLQPAVGEIMVNLLIISLDIPFLNLRSAEILPLGAGQTAGVVEAVAHRDLFVSRIGHP